jgi:hypothetical protein
VILNPQDAAEVRTGSEKSYLDLVGLQVEVGAEERKTNVLDLFESLGYTVKSPQQINSNLEYIVGSVDYLTAEEWLQTQALITSFVNTEATDTSTILLWETVETGVRRLNLGVLVDSSDFPGVVELHYIRVAYTSG